MVPRVGISVLVIQKENILLGRRLNAHGADTWAAPGGHLEFRETPYQCAYRELFEETGLQALSNIFMARKALLQAP